MLLKAIAVVLGAALSADVAVTTHEALSGANNPTVAALGEHAMPLDERNDLKKASASPNEPGVYLKAALGKNPYSSENWIRLSVEDESKGKLADARHDLEEAAVHDAGPAPRWASANFYFRQGDEQKLFLWVNRYRKITHSEEPGLFRMVAESAPDVHTLLSSMPDLACDELGTLLETVRERDLNPNEVVDRMSSHCHDDASSKALDHLMSDFLRSDKPDLANDIRQRIGQEGPLFNPVFTHQATGEGFDWRVNINDSIQVRQSPKQGIQFDFVDRVPSGTVLIFQPIALAEATRYRLSMNFESDPHTEQDFRWELVELSTGRHLASGLDDDNINRIPSWRFKVPRTSKTVALALFYKRAEGELPFQGSMDIKGVGLARELSATPDPGKH